MRRRAAGCSRMLLSVGMLAVVVAGCARATSPPLGASMGGGASGLGASAMAAGADPTGRGAAGTGAEGAGMSAGASTPAGRVTLPDLPSPREFTEAGALSDVHFEFDQYMVRAQDHRTLDTNARWLLEHPGALILIEGHADERGTDEYNLALGERRAQWTRDQLVTRGVPMTRIRIITYGEERPVCPAHTEGCWARNRRAHFLVKA